MASGNEPAVLRVMVEHVNTGVWERALEARSDGPINAGKSPDGVLANLTWDKQLMVGLQPPIAGPNDIIHLLAKLDAADGLDVSDGFFQVAVTDAAGAERSLNATDLGISTDFPAATPATRWLEIGTGYTVPQGVRLKVGSATLKNSTVVSLEDDS